MALDYWLFAGKNGLKGVEPTYRQEPDGRVVTVPDPVNPAVMKSSTIAYCLRTSRIARAEFSQIFPSLLPEEQERLTDLIVMNPRETSLLRNDQDFADTIQNKQVTAAVRLRLTQITRTAQIASTEHIKQEGGGL